jgi:hypothetical protein
VTLLPADVVVRLSGAPGAIAAAAVIAVACNLGKEKQEEANEPFKHSARFTTNGPAALLAMMPNELELALVALVGSFGALNVPQLARAKTVANNVRRPKPRRRISVSLVTVGEGEVYRHKSYQKCRRRNKLRPFN